MHLYSDIETIQDAIRYWRNCTQTSPDNMSIPDKAARLVGIIHADGYREWYQQPLFAELFEEAANLETEANNDPDNERYWQKILDLLNQLEKQYL
jgi:hypothetical protein